MTKFEENILSFNENMYNLTLKEIDKKAKVLFDNICECIHCENMQLNVVEDEESYLYRLNSKQVVINIKFVKQFEKFAHLFLLDTLFIIARTLMQSNFKNFLKERAELGGNFFVVESNKDLPLDYEDIFRLDDIMLLYAEMEQDKKDWHSVTMFDRRAFAFRCMESYLKLSNFAQGQEFLNYLKEDFTLCKEDEIPETPLQIEDQIIAKYKIENQLGFLEEMELREKLFKHIENVLGE